MTTPSGTPYRTEFTGPAEADYLSILQRASSTGVGHDIVLAMRDILARLRLDPAVFGEPMYHLRAMKMEVRKAAVAPLYVEYGVHKDEPIVVIRRVRWLGNPAG